MGRENHHDPTIVHSSIALLQERFRQLERVKEMREERELLKMYTEPKQYNSNNMMSTYYESTKFFSNNKPELIMPSRSPPPSQPPHVSLSLWPTTSHDEDHHKSRVEAQVSMNFCPTQTQSMQASWKKNVYDDWDSGSDHSGVDTSLHL